MKLTISVKKKMNDIIINKQSDVVVTFILLMITVACYCFFSASSLMTNVYLLSLIWYIVGMFYIMKVRVFSGVGLFVIYMFCFVQSGVLMQELYYSFVDEVVISIALYNLFAPLLLGILSRMKKITGVELEKAYVSDNWVLMLFLVGLASMLLFYISVGGVPLFAEDAENFRVHAIAGRGFLVIIATACFKISIMLMSSNKRRMICLVFAVMLLLGTGYRSQALELVLICFITYWIGAGKKYLIHAAIIIGLLCLAYSLMGVLRSGIDWHWETIYKPMIWRFYVNTNNFNTVYRNYPISELQHGMTFVNDIFVILPGAQTTFMTQLKEIMGIYFDGGSLTPSVFGEGYYNWGAVGAVIWPLFVLMFVIWLDDYNKKHIDGRAYFAISFALVGFSTSSFVPVMVNSYLPLLFVYYALVYISKKIRLKFS